MEVWSGLPKKKAQKKERVKKNIQGYKELVEHVCETFKKKKGSKYPFTSTCGAIIKKLLSLYGLFQTMALWDMFLAQDWSWVKDGRQIRVPHDLMKFQTKITILLEDDWKSIAEKYEKEVSAKFQPEFPIEFKKIPKPEDSQANKKKVIETFNETLP